MAQILTLIVCSLAGWLGAHTGKLGIKHARKLNQIVIFISLPALTLLKIHELNFETSAWLAISVAWVVFLGAAIFILMMSRVFKLSRAITGALLLTAGLGNTSFVGFPLLQIYFGGEALKTGILIDQPGTFLILALIGVPVAIRFSGREAVSSWVIVKRVITFPPILALLLALALRGFAFPQNVETVLSWLGWTLAPLALLSVGIQVYGSFQGWQVYKMPLALGLGYKLLIAPILIFLIYGFGLRHFGLGAERLAFQTMVFEAAMAPMITAGAVASDLDLESRLCGLMLAIGIPLSFLSSALWFLFLKSF